MLFMLPCMCLQLPSTKSIAKDSHRNRVLSNLLTSYILLTWYVSKHYKHVCHFPFQFLMFSDIVILTINVRMMEISTQIKTLYFAFIIYDSIELRSIHILKIVLISERRIKYKFSFICTQGISIHDSVCLCSILGNNFSFSRTTISFNNLSLCAILYVSKYIVLAIYIS